MLRVFNAYEFYKIITSRLYLLYIELSTFELVIVYLSGTFIFPHVNNNSLLEPSQMDNIIYNIYICYVYICESTCKHSM